jgi:hypothetical protein
MKSLKAIIHHTFKRNTPIIVPESCSGNSECRICSCGNGRMAWKYLTNPWQVDPEYTSNPLILSQPAAEIFK